MTAEADLATPPVQGLGDTLRVNMTTEEAKSTDREPLPMGKFHFKITDCTVNFVKQGKNQGKPMFNFEFTVQDGQYASRKDWTNAMLFEGALFTISQICKALDVNVPPGGGAFDIPTAPAFYIGKDIWGRRGTNKNDKNDDGSLRIQLRGFSKYTGGASEATGKAGTAASGKTSVLP